MNRPPDILLIHSDQHRFDCTGANGARIVRTPALDRLAAEGVNFTHAFTPCPICSPARASLLTGAWPTTHGCLSIPHTELQRPARAGLPLLTQLLHQQGYATGWVGKFHNEVDGGPGDHGVEDYTGTWPYREWRQQAGLPPEASARGLFGEKDSACPPEASGLAWQAGQVLRLLEKHADSGRPFFIRWDPPEPHLPCRPPAGFDSLYDPAAIPPWPSWPDTLEGKPAVQRRQRDIWGLHDWPWERWAKIVALYYGVITHLDQQIGRILAWLEARGRLDSTLIIYTTDHGDFCGGHGLIDKHFSMYDELLRVPLFVRWPERLPRGAVRDAFVSHEIDIARTLLDAAGIAAPPSFAGQSLLPLAQDAGLQPRPDIFSQYFGTESGSYTSRAVRDRRWKYVYNPTTCDELYDLETDPGERVNLAGRSTHAAELQRLRRRLVEWMESIHDPLANRWTRIHLCGEPPLSHGLPPS